jgi:hypothetical protein
LERHFAKYGDKYKLDVFAEENQNANRSWMIRIHVARSWVVAKEMMKMIHATTIEWTLKSLHESSKWLSTFRYSIVANCFYLLKMYFYFLYVWQIGKKWKYIRYWYFCRFPRFLNSSHTSQSILARILNWRLLIFSVEWLRIIL